MIIVKTKLDKSLISGIEIDENICVASRDIKRGKELTIDYKTLVPKELWESYMKPIIRRA